MARQFIMKTALCMNYNEDRHPNIQNFIEVKAVPGRKVPFIIIFRFRTQVTVDRRLRILQVID